MNIESTGTGDLFTRKRKGILPKIIFPFVRMSLAGAALLS
jgi:hypothetical protein